MKIPGAASWLAVLIFLCPRAGSPGPGETTTREIMYLLTAIEKTECAFLRNDASYSSKEAADHIRKKYNYLEDKIGSAEDFIELCASQSSTSGKPYMIKCGDSDSVPSRIWLQQKLDEFRRERAG